MIRRSYAGDREYPARKLTPIPKNFARVRISRMKIPAPAYYAGRIQHCLRKNDADQEGREAQVPEIEGIRLQNRLREVRIIRERKPGSGWSTCPARHPAG